MKDEIIRKITRELQEKYPHNNISVNADKKQQEAKEWRKSENTKD
ncbi:MAG: hypothetical protein SVK54_07555 [candidate division WOR-3 bacterium]|nr:hypothetical protein [candidate division WOR-3 bacterium]